MIKKIYVLLCIIPMLVACVEKAPSKLRIKMAEEGLHDVVIGVGWPFSVEEDYLRKGLELARDEINSQGGVLGRKVKLLFEDDQASVTAGRYAAQRFANNPEVLAVIGHKNSYVSIATAPIYEFAGIVMITPRSTNPKLTERGYKYIFRMIPNDEIIGRSLADDALANEHRKMAIFYVNNDYGKGLANAFEFRADQIGIEILDRLSYMERNEKYFRQVFQTWKEEHEFDAIFLAVDAPEAGIIIRVARELGINVPFWGGDSLDSPLLLEHGGEATNGTIVATVYHPDDPRAKVQEFNKIFKDRFGFMPDVSAATGYDALKLLCFSMNKAKSTVPARFAGSLRSVDNWEGVTGTHRFDDKGDDIGMPIVKLIVRDGQFHYLSTR